jgi:hypothetical protein
MGFLVPNFSFFADWLRGSNVAPSAPASANLEKAEI